MTVAGREPDIAHRQGHEDDRLDDADDRTERIKRQWNNQPGQAGKDTQYRVVGKHVGVKTNPERKRAEQVVGDIDRDHQEEQPPDRPDQIIAKKLNEPLRFYALIDVIDKAYSTKPEGQVGITGGWFHAWYQPEDVGGQDKHEQRSEERHPQPPVMRLGHVADEPVHPLDQHFADGARADSLVGNHRVRSARQRAARQQTEHNQQAHHDPGTYDDRG